MDFVYISTWALKHFLYVGHRLLIKYGEFGKFLLVSALSPAANVLKNHIIKCPGTVWGRF